jgi:hypothetical protein
MTAECAQESYDPEVYQAAELVIGRHGADAAAWAAQRVRDFVAEGDPVGVALWCAVEGAIRILQAD